jgi:hypothetical protein
MYGIGCKGFEDWIRVESQSMSSSVVQLLSDSLCRQTYHIIE